ncbi:YdiU family protein [Microcoleus sp. FACHB-1515]|uniref:protein adenylyltransferase SelO n=1 Tax=Leptolyngbya sp. FACHB-1515 TaxID=2933931 RepID=UPI0016820779|nr:YdiU family protein [Microcoleus sp. FACHB-1515]MBD2090362.1 YdiU family protein [Microcoleus sp. FACHB-1515]
MTVPNPLLSLPYEPAIESLGDEYFNVVTAAEFPQQILRFRNNDLLLKLGLDPAQVSDADFVEAFGKFQGRSPFLALRYHGYQFGVYNPDLGDGRGFLYGQVRGTDGELYDFGTKGSGKTPYSRGGDGRLTLKGGVREVLAAEMLYVLGVRTSRCLSLIETGEALWRGDEPSPTRSSVMIRMQRSHVRFGTFERLYAIDRPDLIRNLLDHVIDCYYPHLSQESDRYARFYAELVQRVAELAAQWMSVGFCHAVLNTDNMSITGESFDYGPYAFIDRYDPDFTAAYFDYAGRYRYSYQPLICRLNLELLQVPLKCAIDPKDLETAIDQFEDYYHAHYRQRMLQKLGFDQLEGEAGDRLLHLTFQQLEQKEIGYHEFFLYLRKQFSPSWKAEVKFDDATAEWRSTYQQAIAHFTDAELQQVRDRLQRHNPETILLRPEIETVWEAIDQADNWQLFEDLLDRIWKSVDRVALGTESRLKAI